MEIKKEDWTAFAELGARQSEHMCSQYWEDGTYIKCPFSTMERAYAAFSIWQSCHSQSEVKKFWDINVDAYNPDKYPSPMEAEIEREAQEYSVQQEEIEYAFKEAAGMTYFGIDDWNPEWDHYCADREKQIIRIAHELADKHEHLSMFEWINLVWPFYKMYDLNENERMLFSDEYAAQQWFRHGHLQGI